MVETIDGPCGVATDRNTEEINLNANENEAFGEEFAANFVASLETVEKEIV